jgi:hypothetical protein
VAKEVAKAAPVIDVAAQAGDLIYSELMQQVDEAQKDGDFITAKALLSRIRKKMKDAAARAAADAREQGRPEVQERPEDPYIIQRLALVTYKSKVPSAEAALSEARELLTILKPGTSNDTETLGLWGAVHKRLWEITNDVTPLDEALRAYERGFYLRNDYYNGINLAYLLNVRASSSLRRAGQATSSDEVAERRAEAVASFVRARAVRAEVLKICEGTLEAGKLPDTDRYWVLATMAEAYLGGGDGDRAAQTLQEAFAEKPTEGHVLVNRYLDDWKPAQWMIDSTNEQMNKLRTLLDDSPLKYIQSARG